MVQSSKLHTGRLGFDARSRHDIYPWLVIGLIEVCMHAAPSSEIE